MFTLYTKDNCIQCDQAKQLLTTNGIPFQTLKLGVDITRDELLAKIPSARTMPQVMKGDEVIGGFNELKKAITSSAAA